MLQMLQSCFGESKTIPSRCQSQTTRSKAVFVPFADHLLMQMNSRFSELAIVSASGLMLLPEEAVECRAVSVMVSNLEKAFSDDLGAPSSLSQEAEKCIHGWQLAEPRQTQSLTKRI